MSPLWESIIAGLARAGITAALKKPPDDVSEKVHKATDRAPQARFYQAYGDTYGPPSARQRDEATLRTVVEFTPSTPTFGSEKLARDITNITHTVTHTPRK